MVKTEKESEETGCKELKNHPLYPLYLNYVYFSGIWMKNLLKLIKVRLLHKIKKEIKGQGMRGTV
jgi:hypothetical protein